MKKYTSFWQYIFSTKLKKEFYVGFSEIRAKTAESLPLIDRVYKRPMSVARYLRLKRSWCISISTKRRSLSRDTNAIYHRRSRFAIHVQGFPSRRESPVEHISLARYFETSEKPIAWFFPRVRFRSRIKSKFRDIEVSLNIFYKTDQPPPSKKKSRFYELYYYFFSFSFAKLFCPRDFAMIIRQLKSPRQISRALFILLSRGSRARDFVHPCISDISRGIARGPTTKRTGCCCLLPDPRAKWKLDVWARDAHEFIFSASR